MEMIVNKNELFDEVLVRPANEADSLIIVSGFATSAMVEYQISSTVSYTHLTLPTIA